MAACYSQGKKISEEMEKFQALLTDFLEKVFTRVVCSDYTAVQINIPYIASPSLENFQC